MLVEKQNRMKEEEKTDDENDAEQKNPMDTWEADRTNSHRSTKKVRKCECVYLTKRCVLFRNLLTEKEVDTIKQISARSLVEGWGSRQRRNFGKRGSKQDYSSIKSGGHTVIFLEEKFEKKLPHIFSFINKVIHKTDRKTGWNVLSSAKMFNPRRMEFLQYSSKEKNLFKPGSPKMHNDGLGWHYDTDSLISFICMCSHKDEFEGGLLQIKVKQKKGGWNILTVPKFDRGDVVVLRSEDTEHRVTETTGGVRCTFVYELWDQDGYDNGTDTSSESESESSTSSSTDVFEFDVPSK